MKAFPSGINTVYANVAVENIPAVSGGGSSEYPAGHYSLPLLLDNIKGIIFDFDGTLFDNILIPFYLIAACPFDLFRIRKERLIRRRFTGCDYASPDEYYKAFFTALGKACFCSPKRIQNWYFNRYMPRMVRVLKKHYQFRPGARDLFRSFADSDVMRVAVYSDYPFLKERLEALGLSPGPDILLYGPESFGAQKPAAGPFLRIAAALGAAPEETLVIGDREDTDGLGAFRAGMHFFCLETGRKRYVRFDPYRRRPMRNEQEPGPSLLMYTGGWDSLVKLLIKQIKNKKVYSLLFAICHVLFVLSPLPPGMGYC
jgi:FMN phosphatase YigB (HAD superfamily)